MKCYLLKYLYLTSLALILPMAICYHCVTYCKYYTSCLISRVSNQGNNLQKSRDNMLIEHSDDNSTILQQTSLSSSLCTDDTQALLQVNAISRRVAIAKKELSSTSSGSRSHDTMRTPSPRRHSSSFNPLLMSTPHPTAKSRLEGVANNWSVANNWGVTEEVESISSINSEVGVASSVVCTLIDIYCMVHGRKCVYMCMCVSVRVCVYVS